MWKMSVLQSDPTLSADPAVLASPPSEPAPVHRFTVKQYYRMAKQGILTPDDRVELLEGIIVDMNAILAPHAYTVERTRKILERMAPSGWIVRAQQPVSLDGSEPQPDVAVDRGSDADFAFRHPRPGEIGLLVEVSDTTLRRDRGSKRAIYAAAGVPEYWIVNLVGRQVEIYLDPQSPGDAAPPSYAAPTILGAGDRVPFRLSGQLLGEIPIADILPPLAENQTP
jgi:Uma2 family endonuclease